MSTSLEARQQTRNSTKQSCNASATLCADIALRSGVLANGHDNAPAYRAVATSEFLAKHNIPSLPHPPYSPDLAPCDFFLFLQLKKTMKGCRFYDIEEVQANATRQMRDITKSDYRRCFRLWQERWNKCIQAQGHYFEGDKSN